MSKVKFFFARFQPLFLCLVLLLTVRVICSYDYHRNRLAPIILVHGMAASQLEGKFHTLQHPEGCAAKSWGKEGWEKMWINHDTAIAGKHYQSCWGYRFKLLYNRATHKCSNQVGVDIRVKGKLGSLAASEYLSDSPILRYFPRIAYFRGLIKGLKRWGYSERHSLKAFSYDWRYAPPQLDEMGYYDRFTDLVESVTAKTNRKVMIVAHSLGGLVSAFFLINQTQEWKDRHIHAFVSVGTPWLGSTVVLEPYLVGSNQGVITIDKRVTRDFIKTFQSMAFLLPQEEAYRHTTLVEWVPENKKYTSKDYQEFFRDLGWEDAYLMRQDLRSLYPVPLKQLGVKYHCVWSNTSWPNTRASIRVQAAKLYETRKVDIEGVMEGDFAVPMRSLRYCEKFRSKNVTVKSYQRVKHKELLDMNTFHDHIISVAKNARRYS